MRGFSVVRNQRTTMTPVAGGNGDRRSEPGPTQGGRTLQGGRSLLHIATLVNLGLEVYMQAEAPDTRHIFVDIELGFHVEFTWSETLKFIQLREEKMARKIEEYTDLIASIKAQIKVVGQGIRELLQLSAEMQDRDTRVF